MLTPSVEETAVQVVKAEPEESVAVAVPVVSAEPAARVVSADTEAQAEAAEAAEAVETAETAEVAETAEPVEQQDGHTDDRGDPRGQHSAEDSHIQGEDEQIVQQDIGQAAHQHG